LTVEEQIDYVKKEALATKRESKVYLDSLDKANNKLKPLNFLIGTGYNPRNRFKKGVLSIRIYDQFSFL
jgi:hypothetical protein